MFIVTQCFLYSKPEVLLKNTPMLQGWHSGNNPNVFKGLEENKLLLSQLDESQFCCTPSSSVCPLTSSLHWGWSLHRDKQDFRADQLLKRNSFVCYWRPSDHYISTTIDLCSEVKCSRYSSFFQLGLMGINRVLCSKIQTSKKEQAVYPAGCCWYHLPTGGAIVSTTLRVHTHMGS